MSLDNLEKELYRKNSDIVKRRSVSKKNASKSDDSSDQKEEVAQVWEELKNESSFREEEPISESQKAKKGIFKKAVIIVAALSILIVVSAVIILFSGGNRNNGSNINLSIIVPSEVNRGVPFEVTVDVVNRFDTLITGAVLSFNLPPGIAHLTALGGPSPTVEETIGDIGAGSLAKRTFKFLPVGEENSSLKINAKFIYTSGGRARFEANEAKTVLIRGSGIKLEVKKPEFLLQGSTFEFEVSYKNTSDFSFPEVVLETRYPTSFKFISASLRPDSLNNYWRLGALESGSTGKLQVKGTFEGGSDIRLSIPVIIYARFSGQDYKLAEDVINLEVAPSPINLQILVNRQQDYIARIGDSLTYNIQYQNNSGIALADLIVKATPVGELFDFSSINTNGAIDYAAGSITWNASQIDAFKLLSPGASGEVSFNISLKQQFPIRRMNDKNFYVRLNIEIDSPSVPYYLSAAKTKSSVSLETKVAGLVFFDAQAFYRDAPSGIVNSGKIPFQANKSTDITVHWVIKNYSTDIKNVSVKSALKPGVEWTGVVKSNIDSKPTYNNRTGEVIWNIEKKISATTGVINDPVEAVFQIRVTPSVVNVGQAMFLLAESVFKAVDDFTGLEISRSDTAIDSTLPDDRTLGQGSGVVLP
ncbi:MAG: hypothetical protein QMD65_00020 [Patescibacteria group bacterium]|nr:hypothetical protein [Patescibacteria group bacterium]